MKSVQITAYAKINLFLDIVSLRKDGYHNLLSIMQSVSLGDTVTVEYEKYSGKKIEIECNCPTILQDSQNLAYKAADKIIESGYVKIKIEKNIFISSGLAGGSADAAAVLAGLSRLLFPITDTDRFIKIGSKIGADIPFCMTGGTKLVTGIGDIYREFPEMPPANIVLACMGEGVSTPQAYNKLDSIYKKFENYTPATDNAEYIERCFSEKKLPGRSFNIFENVVLPSHTDAAKIKRTMYDCGAALAMMSGSGPSVFGIFIDSASAAETADVLRQMGANAILCEPRKSGLEIIREN